MSDVSTLLAASWAAHMAYKQASRDRQRDRAKQLLTQAAMKRVQALELDPDRTDPAWAAEASRTPPGEDTHTSMMRFYAAQGVLDHGV